MYVSVTQVYLVPEENGILDLQELESQVVEGQHGYRTQVL